MIYFNLYGLLTSCARISVCLVQSNVCFASITRLQLAPTNACHVSTTAKYGFAARLPDAASNSVIISDMPPLGSLEHQLNYVCTWRKWDAFSRVSRKTKFRSQGSSFHQSRRSNLIDSPHCPMSGIVRCVGGRADRKPLLPSTKY